MATQIESTIYNSTGEHPMSVTVRVTTDAYAAAITEVRHDDWSHHGWREEIHELTPIKSVQVLYDSLGNVWETHELTELDKLTSGQPII